MIQLHGFSISNYYNKVKMALLEKGVPFEECYKATGNAQEEMLACSPLGKVPYITTERGALCESQAILEYLEAVQPEPPLLPPDPWEAAKVRELCTFVDLHLELVARELYSQAFFGGAPLSEAHQARVRKLLTKNIAGFKRLARFAPYLAGERFTMADCCGYVSLPLVSMASKAVYGECLLGAAGVDWKPYIALVGQRPSAQRVSADRKRDTERAAAARAAAKA
jgi:glutathione S-transferase